MSRASVYRAAQRQQFAERAKLLVAEARELPSTVYPPLHVLFRLADPIVVRGFWPAVRDSGELLTWLRRACVLRAWCALRIAKTAPDPVAWRRIARAELARAAQHARDERRNAIATRRSA